MTEKFKRQMDYVFEVPDDYAEDVCDNLLEHGSGTYGVLIEDGKTDFWQLHEDYFKNDYWVFVSQNKEFLDQFLALEHLMAQKK